MANKSKILKMALNNNGTVTTKQVTAQGFSRGSLRYLVAKGLLEHSARGVYILPSIFDDELFNLQTRFKKGVFSQETALFLHGYSDRTPSRYQMTLPIGYNTSTLRIKNVKCYRAKDEFYNLGICEVRTPGGNIVRAYEIERTLCDILRGNSHTDIQLVTDAFKRYTQRKTRNVPLLSDYAKKLRVEKKLRSYLEVLL